MRVLNTRQMRDADRRTIDEIGIPSIVLMENAGRQAVAAMEAAFDDLATSQVGVLCGRGNNGGDGFVVARTLIQRGVDVGVFLLGSVAEITGDARINLEVLGRIGLTVVEITSAQEWELHFTEISECDLVVDAILGTGFRGQLSGLLETVVADVNALGVPVVAIDLPTGVSADTHVVEGAAIEASMTVTLGAPKIPLVFPPADSHGGDLVIADIGIPYPVFEELEGEYLELLTRERMREIVPARAADSHKGDFGRVLVVAGSNGRTGAAHLSAIGALRSGAGLVTIATPQILRADHRRDGAGIHDRRSGRDRVRHDRLRRDRSSARYQGGRDRGRTRSGPGSEHVGVRARAGRARGRPARSRCRRAERVRWRAGTPHGPRRSGRDHHAASGGNGSTAEHIHREGPDRTG